jgi:hypothetical protein
MSDTAPPIPGGGRAFEPVPNSHVGFTGLDLHGLTVLVGTKKGAFFLTAAPGRRRFDLNGPAFLGHIVHHAVVDPRDRRTLLLATRTGHLGPTVFRSTDFGRAGRNRLSRRRSQRRPTVANPTSLNRSSG